MSTPYSLVLSKNQKYFDVLHSHWENLCTVAQKHIQAVDAEVGLGPFLAEIYEKLVSLSMISGGAARNHRQPPIPNLAPGTLM
jgi:hypothetical protein